MLLPLQEGNEVSNRRRIIIIRRRRQRRQTTVPNPSSGILPSRFLAWYCIYSYCLLLDRPTTMMVTSSSSSSSSYSSGSFPGTFKPNAEDWWTRSPIQRYDDHNDDDSSSDWEWPLEEPSEDLVTLSLDQASSLSAEATTRNVQTMEDSRRIKGKSNIQDEENKTDIDQVELVKSDNAMVMTQDKTFHDGDFPTGSSEIDRIDDSTTVTVSKETSETTANNNKRRTNYPSNKPLETLEKLRQMLNETENLKKTSSTSTVSSSSQTSSTSTPVQDFVPITEDISTQLSDEYDAIAGPVVEEDSDFIDTTPLSPPSSSPWNSNSNEQSINSQQQQQQQHQYPATNETSIAPTAPTKKATTISSTAATVQTLDQSTSSIPHPPRTQGVPPDRVYEYFYPPRPSSTSTSTSSNTMEHRMQPKANPSNLETAMSPPDMEDPSDTDDGLGYTLPNLPIYLSDDEGGETDAAGSPGYGHTAAAPADQASAATAISMQQQQQQQQQQLQQQQQQRPEPPSMPQVEPHPQTPLSPGMSYPGYAYAPPQWYGPNIPPYGYYPPPPPPLSPAQLHQYYMQQYQPQPQPQMAPGTQPGFVPPYYFHPRPYVPQLQGSGTVPTRVPRSYPRRIISQSTVPIHPQGPINDYASTDVESDINFENHPSSSNKHFRLTMDSLFKLSTCLILASIVCYAAVSPYTLPLLEYNQKFYENLRLAGMTMLSPMVIVALVIDPAENHLSKLINAFYNSFTIGYVVTFGLEVVAATFCRLAVFVWWEPKVFHMTPKVPLVVIPWVLREQKYLVKPITLIVQDLVTSVAVCPLMEEWIKLVLLQWTVPLGKNFQWVSRPSKKNPRRRKQVAEPIQASSTQSLENVDKEPSSIHTPGHVTNVNQYVSGMLAVSLGLKLADAIRRVCMYTKEDDMNKGFYALFRGIFPIQELCGTVTALGLARRDVLGQKMPLWKLLLPAAIIHGMANFRGMKPIFKWNSATPWSEMQLSPNFLADGATLTQLAGKAFPKVMWVIILMRVTGYCAKNYFMINRQAVKRTTTYAGKHAAFSAELAAAEMLKSTKNSKEKKEKP